ncbi:hypothetical protein INR49_002826 [Caranx melampygus]|nr:hypothetical protein INR49_002826 [Caranx melampygus]
MTDENHTLTYSHVEEGVSADPETADSDLQFWTLRFTTTPSISLEAIVDDDRTETQVFTESLPTVISLNLPPRRSGTFTVTSFMTSEKGQSNEGAELYICLSLRRLGHLQQLLFELLRVVGQLCHSVHHVLDGVGVGVVEGSHLGGGHHCLQQVAQHITGVHHGVGHLRRGGLSGQRVPDEDQLVGAEDDKLAVCYEYTRWLAGADTAEEGVNSAEQRDKVLLALLRVEGQQLTVPRAQGGTVCGRGHT